LYTGFQINSCTKKQLKRTIRSALRRKTHGIKILMRLVWMSEYFGVLREYYGLTKYFGFRK
jgi:hypothetical protein